MKIKLKQLLESVRIQIGQINTQNIFTIQKIKLQKSMIMKMQRFM